MSARNLQPELMDDPALDPAEHARALDGLARINLLSNAAAPLWRALQSLCETRAARATPLRILDVATGSGDVLLRLHRRAARAGIPLDLAACDISPVALDAVTARFAAGGVGVRTIAADITRAIPLADRAVDVACCSLFLHHLTGDQAEHALAEMARVSALGVIAVDIRRCGAGLAAASVIPRLLTHSRVVHVDAVRSVRAAWTEPELLELARRAGLAGATVRRVWPWRMTLLWRRPGSS